MPHICVASWLHSQILNKYVKTWQSQTLSPMLSRREKKSFISLRPDLYYQHGPTLMQAVPKPFVDALIQESRCRCYKTFYSCNLRIFVISYYECWSLAGLSSPVKCLSVRLAAYPRGKHLTSVALLANIRFEL